MNEYVARNQAIKKSRGEVLAIIDDDAYADRNWLSRAEPHFAKGVVTLTGKIVGNPLGKGSAALDKKYLGTGTNLFIKRKAFDQLGGFETDWGLARGVPGWRSDTDLLWRAIDRFGDCTYVHDSKVIVHHPDPLQSKAVPEIEDAFVRRHPDKCRRYLAPIDPKIRAAISRMEEMPRFVTQDH